MTDLPPLVVIAGATATGKTGLSLRLAERLAADGVTAEIVCADSRQVYRGLDIGTAKATAEEQAQVPHHGLDLVDPDEPFTVADYAGHAREALGRIAGRGAIALMVGGTGLYLRAVARGLDTAALPHDPAVRSRIEGDLATDGLAQLVERLGTIAPVLSAEIDVRNPRRVVRALEIAEIRGDGGFPPPLGYPAPVVWIGLTVEPSLHRTWIEARARGQFEAGLLDEARTLRERYDPTLPAFSAIGYREAWAVLDGDVALDAAIELDAARNVAFAKRQRTWFRAEPDIAWYDVTDGPRDDAVQRHLARALGLRAERIS